MTRIDFYTLADLDLEARWRFGARLAERAWKEERSIYVHVDNDDDAARVDRFLWEYPSDRFLPHGIVGTPDANHAPIRVGWRCDDDRDDVLINLSEHIPEAFARFARVCEVIVQEPTRLQGGRARYKFYRERGYPLEHHQIKARDL